MLAACSHSCVLRSQPFPCHGSGWQLVFESGALPRVATPPGGGWGRLWDGGKVCRRLQPSNSCPKGPSRVLLTPLVARSVLHRYLCARRGAHRRRRPDHPRTRRCRRRHCRRCRRRRRPFEPPERPRGRHAGPGVTDVGAHVVLRGASGTGRLRGGSRRAEPGLAVTHGHAGAGRSPGEARRPPL